MSYLKKGILLVSIIAFIVCFFGCNSMDSLNDFFEKNYDYSDTGKEEIEAVFEDVLEDDFTGQISYIFKTKESYNPEKPFTVTNIKYNQLHKENENNIIFLEVETDEENYGFLYDNVDSYYIDYNEKTVTNYYHTIKGFEMLMNIQKFGIFELKENNKLRWEFTTKKEAEIKDIDGKKVDTVEFVYSYIEDCFDKKDYTSKLNFNKKECKLERMHYQSINLDTEQKEDEIIIYIKDVSTDVDESLFELPEEEDGYSFDFN